MYNKKTQNPKKDGSGNTRPNLKNSVLAPQLTIGVDYLRYKLESLLLQDENNERLDFNSVIELIYPDGKYAIFTNGAFSLGRGTRKYANKYVNVHGVQVLFDIKDADHQADQLDKKPQDDTQLVDFVVDYPGHYLQSMNLKQIHLLNNWSRAVGMRCLRGDINQTVPPEFALQIDDIKNAYKQKNFTGFKNGEQHGDLDDTDQTIYLGSRESSRLIRIYDTLEKHKFEGQRFEVEYKRSKARVLSEKLDSFVQEFDETDEQFCNRLAKEIQSILLAEVDFIDKSVQYSNGTIQNCPRLKWWQNYIDAVKGVVGQKIKDIRTPRDLQRTLDWLHRQVSKSLYLFKAGLGDDFSEFIKGVMKNCSRRLNKMDKLFIDSISESPSAWMQSQHYT